MPLWVINQKIHGQLRGHINLEWLMVAFLSSRILLLPSSRRQTFVRMGLGVVITARRVFEWFGQRYGWRENRRRAEKEQLHRQLHLSAKHYGKMVSWFSQDGISPWFIFIFCIILTQNIVNSSVWHFSALTFTRQYHWHTAGAPPLPPHLTSPEPGGYPKKKNMYTHTPVSTSDVWLISTGPLIIFLHLRWERSISS